MTFWENILLRKLNILHANQIKYDVFTDRVRINQEASPFLKILPFFHSSLVKISHILKAMIFQFRVDIFLRPNNEKTTSDFIMCVSVYSKYIHLQNRSKTNDFRYQISRLFVLLKQFNWWNIQIDVVILWRMWNFQGVWLSHLWRGIWSMHELSISETICKVVER